MNNAQIKNFRLRLEAKRDKILKDFKDSMQALNEDMMREDNEFSDEMELAWRQIRLGDSEKTLLDKIQKALLKIEDGRFGKCDECDEEISTKRLEAQPEEALCIRCKHA